MAFITEKKKGTPEIHKAVERPQMSKAVLTKNKARGIILRYFKACYKATIIQTLWFHIKKNRYKDT